MQAPLFAANRTPSPCAVCHSPLMLYSADFGKRVLQVGIPFEVQLEVIHRNILITASCVLVLSKSVLNWSQSSSLCGGTEPSCFKPLCSQWGRVFCCSVGKIFLVIVYWLLSFSSDIFSSKEAMPNSFPKIYRNLKFVPLIQNSQEFSEVSWM